ncbi:glycoside hydrolase family 16 protein [Coniochaeta sp. 2T2.1]|nr:glycoside hydrolase family 16 protein [Coniochaeta sp. 2T2.1]
MRSTTILSLLPGLVSAWSAPSYGGLNTIWQDGFEGSAGAPPSDLWNIAQDIHTNNEVQVYTSSNHNLQISGGSTIQFVPRKSPSGLWTSARIESRASFTPQPGKVLQVEATIRLGSNPQSQKQGVWPAFWMLGESIHHGTQWPQCGELDIFEQVSGVPTGYGTAHCVACNEPLGKVGTTGIPVDDGFHTWSIRIDRTPGDWAAETISWSLDGSVYHTLTGGELGDQGVWATLAHSPLFVILNLAVGGDWPGAPNDATLDGYGSMMEVGYVAVYSS